MFRLINKKKNYIQILNKYVRFFSFANNDSFKEKIEKFVNDEIIPKAAYYDETGEYPWDLIRKAHSLGIMNSQISKELGGFGMSLKEKVQLFEKIACGDVSIGSSLMVSELAQIPLIMFGSDYLKHKYLKWMLNEPILAAYAVTEENAGSDLANVKTSAILNEDNYILNGSKSWITNGGIASWFFILARTNRSLNCSTSKALTGFIVDSNTKGLSFGKKERNMGQRCLDTRTLTLENVIVPKKNVVGKVGDGFKIVMNAFNSVRPVIASLACGLSQRALDEATNYALNRKTFNKKIIDYQAISFKLANIALKLEAARALTYKSAQMVDENNNNSNYFSSCAKVFASETAFQAAADAIQVFGGNGFCCDYPVEKLLRDSKLLHIYGGTNEIQRIIISRNLISKTLKKS